MAAKLESTNAALKALLESLVESDVMLTESDVYADILRGLEILDCDHQPVVVMDGGYCEKCDSHVKGVLE